MIRKIGKLIRQIRFIFDRRQKLELTGVLILIAVTTFIELAGVAVIFPFIEVLMEPETIRTNQLLWDLYQLGSFQSAEAFLAMMAALMIVVYIVKNLLTIFSYNFQYRFTFRNQKNIAARMLQAYLAQPYGFHLSHNSSELIRGINMDVSMMFQAVLAILGFLAETLVCLVLGAYLLVVDPMMTLLVVAVLGGFVLIFLKKFRSYLLTIGEEDRNYNLGFVKWLQQSFDGLKETKVLNRESFFQERFEDQYDHWADLEQVFRSLQMIPKPIMETLCIAAIMVAVIIKLLTGTDMRAFVGTISVFAVAAFRLLPSFNRLTVYLNAISFNYPAFDAVYRELEQIEEISGAGCAFADLKDVEPFDFESAIEVRDLSYRYPTGEKTVLEGLSLSIPKNRSVAFIGPSGAGKTTLADIILGVLTPAQGSVYVDGVDVFTD
ncbi:MAG: ATP-binding cassette domain-containing protein, partial [Lachnospiraceae bacterium]|nr:ATP-binding cassette domain-containing protein [Lachnospiraceae bacterium]